MKLTIDFETRSVVDLPRCGAWVYAEDEKTEIMCLAVKAGDQAPEIWLPDNFLRILGGRANELPLISMPGLHRCVAEADEIEAHNASSFELPLWELCFAPKYGAPALPRHKLRCSMAKGSYHSLPRKLETLCEVLGVEQQKDVAGANTMRKMCKPKRRVRAEWTGLSGETGLDWKELKNLQTDLYKLAEAGWGNVLTNWRGRVTPEDLLCWHEDPEDILTLARYCLQDVEAEHAASSSIPDLPEREQRIWSMDLEINARGVFVDRESAKAMIGMVDAHSARLLGKLESLTGGTVKSPRQSAKYLDEVNKHLPPNLRIANIQAATVKAALADERVTGTARELLEIRKSLALSSVAKYQSILDRASSDGRVRDTLLYHGAGTGRWAGKGIQPQNLPRGKFKDAELAIEVVNDFGPDAAEAIFGDPMAIASTCIRGTITAGDGMEFTCSDYSNIEGRGVAWLAGEKWKLDSFFAFDRGEGPDNYKLAYSRAFGIPIEQVTKDNRQIGKVMELACFGATTLVLTLVGWKQMHRITVTDKIWDGEGFVEHDGVFRKGVRGTIDMFGVAVTPEHRILTGTSWAHASDVVQFCGAEAKALLTGRRMNGPADLVIAPEMERCRGGSMIPVFDILNCGPRNRYMILTKKGPMIAHNCGYQGGVGAFQTMASTYGVKVPDEQAKELVALWRSAHPNVVALWYGLEEASRAAVQNPAKAYSYLGIAYKMSRCGRFLLCKLPSGRLVHYPFPKMVEAEMPWGGLKEVIEYSTTDSQTRKFVRSKLYGGLLAENATQAISRDVMCEGMFRVADAGYSPVLTVHDEVLAEHPVGFGSVDEFSRLLSVQPAWAEGFPIAAAGWRGKRYRKD